MKLCTYIFFQRKVVIFIGNEVNIRISTIFGIVGTSSINIAAPRHTTPGRGLAIAAIDGSVRVGGVGVVVLVGVDAVGAGCGTKTIVHAASRGTSVGVFTAADVV